MAQGTSKLVFGTTTLGGGFSAYGWPYAEGLNAADASLGIVPIHTKGSTENAALPQQARESTFAHTWAAAPSLDLMHPGVLRHMRAAELVHSHG